MKVKNSSVKKTVLAALLILSLIVSLLALSSCGNDGAEVPAEVPAELKSEERTKARNDVADDDRTGYIEAIEKYVAYLNGDPSGMKDLRPADFYEELSMTPDEYVELLQKTVDNSRQTNIDTYGEGYGVTYEIKSEKNYDVMLDSLKSTLKEKQGIEPERIEKAYSVCAEFTIKGPKAENARTTYIFATKIDGSWYLVNAAGEFN